MAASPAVFGDADEWEVCNDDGFVYKRRRRWRHPESPPLPAPLDDPEAELRRRRRARKKQCLIAIRDKYLTELAQWETLSSSLLTSPLPPPPPVAAAAPSSPQPSSQGPPCHPLVDDLLLQVEAQELMLQKLTQTCEYVESVCEERERLLARSILDLPIWVIQREPWEHIKDEDIRKTASSFLGEIWQVPPMFSAIKVAGEKMYDKARRGEMVELAPRRISIFDFVIERSLEDRQNLIFRVTCTKGTYIRSLCADFGKALGSCAHLTALRRDAIGEFLADDAWSFQELQEKITKGYL